MIYIVAAFYAEAKPWIESFHLVKNNDIHKFQVFSNDNTILIISNIGKVNAAIAVTYILSIYPPDDTSILINCGICGIMEPTNVPSNGFLCHKIIDIDSNRTFYPDFFIDSFTFEATLCTSSYLVSLSNRENFIKSFYQIQPKSNRKGVVLVDMEASGIYEAASYFMQPHQMIFYKIISDSLEYKVFTEEDIVEFITPHITLLNNYTENLSSLILENKVELLNETELSLMNQLFDFLHLSTTMRYQLRQYFIYGKRNELPIIDLLNDLLKEPNIRNCTSKKEGKKYFESIQQRLA